MLQKLEVLLDLKYKINPFINLINLNSSYWKLMITDWTLKMPFTNRFKKKLKGLIKLFKK